jgi:hypothetical protein
MLAVLSVLGLAILAVAALRYPGGATGDVATPTRPAVVAPSPAFDFAPTDLSTVEVEPASREMWLLLSSEPAGAEVSLEGAALGTTPLARKVTIVPGARTRSFTVRRAGYAEEIVELDVTGEEATADVRLRRLGGTKKAAETTGTAAAEAPLTAIVADNVRFTGEEAAAGARFVNGASHSELLGAGVAPRQVAIILEKRPFTDVAALAETPFIGDKTIEAIRAAARKGR